MTFDEWWIKLGVEMSEIDSRPLRQMAKAAWESSTKAERERCAKVAEAGEIKCDGLFGPLIAKERERIAAAIRNPVSP